MSIIESSFHYRGFQCCVIFQDLGHRCGYVKIPYWHPAYEKSWDELDIKCHGGITYASHSLLGKTHASGWWIGFDCAHFGDIPDVQSAIKYFNEGDEEQRKTLNFLYNLDKGQENFGSVKTLDYCIQQCRSIVDQLMEME